MVPPLFCLLFKVAGHHRQSKQTGHFWFKVNKELKMVWTDIRQDPPPLIWVFVIFDFFAPWYRKSKEASSVKISWKKIQRKRWSNVPPKLLACIRFLYKVVHKNGRLPRKFNRAREIEFNFFIVWTIFMKLGTLVHHVHGYKKCVRFFKFLPRDLVMVFQSRKTGAKSSLNFERS